LDVLFITHLESNNLVLGFLSGIIGAKIELKLGNKGVVVVGPDGDILGAWVDDGRFKPSESITSKVGDHAIDPLVILDRCRGVILEVEDALERKVQSYVRVLAIKSIGVPYSGLRLLVGGETLTV
jgi:hypothetical protein